MKRTRFIVIFVFFVVMSVYALAEQEKASSAIKRLEEKDLEKMIGEKKPASQEVIVRPNVEYKASDLRDPFQSPFASGEAPVAGPEVSAAPQIPPSLEVQGIIWGGDFPQAIINNKVVKIGDTIEGVQIMDINQGGVVVKIGDTIEGVQIMDINQGGVAVVSGNYTYNLPSPSSCMQGLGSPAQKQEKERQGGEK